MKKLIVFVCTGNTCRSPMAEGIFRKFLAESGLRGVEVASAGVGALEGVEPSLPAQKVSLASQVDLSHVRSSRLTEDLVRDADLIIVMEKGHEREVRSLVRGAASKTILLNDLLPPSDPWSGRDLPDPIGGPEDEYRTTFERIREALRSGWPEIERRLRTEEPPRGRSSSML